jgi:hypothetical protein
MARQNLKNMEKSFSLEITGVRIEDFTLVKADRARLR